MAMLMTKKTLDKFGGKLNESAGSSVSAFARRQMEKFGWKEGRGLGKNEDGMSDHIKTKKREENSGLGSEVRAVEAAADDWWHHGFTNALTKVPSSDKKKKGKKKEKSKEKKKEKDKTKKVETTAPSFEDLFRATGGKRLGMRARGSQKGKLARTEDIANVDSKTMLVNSHTESNSSKNETTTLKTEYKTGDDNTAPSSAETEKKVKKRKKSPDDVDEKKIKKKSKRSKASDQ